jgi:hypothetical protein
MTITLRGPAKIEMRFRHHQLGIDIDARVDGGAWQLVELVSAKNFSTIEEQWAFPNAYMQRIGLFSADKGK